MHLKQGSDRCQNENDRYSCKGITDIVRVSLTQVIIVLGLFREFETLQFFITEASQNLVENVKIPLSALLSDDARLETAFKIPIKFEQFILGTLLWDLEITERSPYILLFVSLSLFLNLNHSTSP